MPAPDTARRRSPPCVDAPPEFSGELRRLKGGSRAPGRQMSWPGASLLPLNGGPPRRLTQRRDTQPAPLDHQAVS